MALTKLRTSGVTDDAITSAKLSDTFGMVLLNTTTVSDAVSEVAFSSSLITDTYDDYIVIGRYLKPATDGQAIVMYTSIDNGSNYNLTIQHSSVYEDLSTDASGRVSGFNQDNTSSAISLGRGIGNDGTGGVMIHCRLFGLRNTSYYKHGHVSCVGTHSAAETNNYHWSGGFRILTTSAINRLKFQFDSGNVAHGIFSLYGVNSS